MHRATGPSRLKSNRRLRSISAWVKATGLAFNRLRLPIRLRRQLERTCWIDALDLSYSPSYSSVGNFRGLLCRSGAEFA